MKHEWIVTHKHPSGSPKEPEGVDCEKCGLSAMCWVGSLYFATEDVALALFKKWDPKDIPRVGSECRGKTVHIADRERTHSRCGLLLTTGREGTWTVRPLESHPEEGREATCYKCRNSCHLCGGQNVFLSVKECLSCFLARKKLLDTLRQRAL